MGQMDRFGQSAFLSEPPAHDLALEGEQEKGGEESPLATRFSGSSVPSSASPSLSYTSPLSFPTK